jgi:hypothetical protein
MMLHSQRLRSQLKSQQSQEQMNRLDLQRLSKLNP